MEQMTEAKAKAMKNGLEAAVKQLNETFLGVAKETGLDIGKVKGVSGIIRYDEASKQFALNDGIFNLVVSVAFGDVATPEEQVKRLALLDRLKEQEGERSASGSVIQGL